MPPKDRTAEFHSTFNSIKARTAAPQHKAGDKAKQPLLKDANGVGAGPSKNGTKSEFGRMAGGIAKDINSTTLKLQKLAQREIPANPSTTIR